MLEAGARREGVLLVVSNGAQNAQIIDQFKKRYPFIRVTSTHGDSAELTKKSIEEFIAGLYDADMFELTAEGLLQLRHLGILQSFRTPEAQSFAPEAVGPDNQWVSLREGLLGIGYNSKLVPQGSSERKS
jgi:ABC-type Fe3+ transport system substrate-binding protein